MKYIVCYAFYLCTLLCIVGGQMPQQSPPNYRKRSLTDPAPSSGKQKLLVLAVEYPSQKGKYTGAQWKNDYFSVWNSFYQSQSYNTLQYDFDIVTIDGAGSPVINDPTSTKYIPLPSELSKYANGEYGWRFDSAWNLHTIVRDASAYLDSKKFDWTPYIQLQNGQRKIVNVLVMSAGTDYRYAQSQAVDAAASKYLLSTSFSGVYYTTTTGNATLNSYTFCSEHTQAVGSPLEMARLGQCAHEFGHALGVPDLYDVSNQCTGVGYFDLLGYGVYANGNQDGSTPIGYGAFPKTALGWAQPIEIVSETEIDLGPSSLSATNFLKIYPNANDTSLYYLVENRQAIDTWDKNFVDQYDTGILIWRVNEADVKQYTSVNHVNTLASSSSGISNCPSTPAVVLIEADGKQDMSTKGSVLNYGSKKDIWQLGTQYVAPNDVSIAVIGLKDQVYTIHVSYVGPIDIQDYIKSSSASSPLASSPLFLVSFLLVILACIA